jgi:hypothetical protein
LLRVIYLVISSSNARTKIRNSVGNGGAPSRGEVQDVKIYQRSLLGAGLLIALVYQTGNGQAPKQSAVYPMAGSEIKTERCTGISDVTEEALYSRGPCPRERECRRLA